MVAEGGNRVSSAQERSRLPTPFSPPREAGVHSEMLKRLYFMNHATAARSGGKFKDVHRHASCSVTAPAARRHAQTALKAPQEAPQVARECYKCGVHRKCPGQHRRREWQAANTMTVHVQTPAPNPYANVIAPEGVAYAVSDNDVWWSPPARLMVRERAKPAVAARRCAQSCSAGRQTRHKRKCSVKRVDNDAEGRRTVARRTKHR